MIEQAISRLKYILEIIPSLLLEIDEASFSATPAPGKWSKKEIIGHLIDSAANNHQRFVRVQFETNPTIAYDQNNWNKHSRYAMMHSRLVIESFTAYNRYLLQLLQLIPAEFLKRHCHSGDRHSHTLEFIIVDYVSHMEHHLKQVVSY
jgi:hypothetical protein